MLIVECLEEGGLILPFCRCIIRQPIHIICGDGPGLTRRSPYAGGKSRVADSLRPDIRQYSELRYASLALNLGRLGPCNGARDTQP